MAKPYVSDSGRQVSPPRFLAKIVARGRLPYADQIERGVEKSRQNGGGTSVWAAAIEENPDNWCH